MQAASGVNRSSTNDSAPPRRDESTCNKSPPGKPTSNADGIEAKRTDEGRAANPNATPATQDALEKPQTRSAASSRPARVINLKDMDMATGRALAQEIVQTLSQLKKHIEVSAALESHPGFLINVDQSAEEQAKTLSDAATAICLKLEEAAAHGSQVSASELQKKLILAAQVQPLVDGWMQQSEQLLAKAPAMMSRQEALSALVEYSKSTAREAEALKRLPGGYKMFESLFDEAMRNQYQYVCGASRDMK